MDNFKLEEIKLEVQNLIALRTGYNAIIIVLTGGLIGLFYNITILNITLLVLGVLLDLLFLSKSNQVTKRIYFLIKKVGE